VEQFLFEIGYSQDHVEVLENKMPATEAWHLSLKHEPLEAFFHLPESSTAEILDLVAKSPAKKLQVDLQDIFVYSTTTAGIETQKQNQSAFMKHWLTVIGQSKEKRIALVLEMLKQPDSWFQLYFNGFPEIKLQQFFFAVLSQKQSLLLKAITGNNNLNPKARRLILASYLEWITIQPQPALHFQDLEKLLLQIEQKPVDARYPKQFMTEIVRLLVQHRFDNFEYIIRRWYMFGYVDEEVIGPLEPVLEALNAVFSLESSAY
jgi:hypothetical protein